MPIFMREKLILAKLESNYGTDAAPAGADAVLAKDVSLSPMEGQDIDRELEFPYFGSQGTIAADLHSKISFSVELAGSGKKGTAPAWDGLLRACAVASTTVKDTSVAYKPITSPQESISLHFYMDKTRYIIKGARGSVRVEINASAIPMLMFEFTGLFALPSEQTRPSPDYTKYQTPIVVSAANTPTVVIDTNSLPVRSFTLDLANEVSPRFLIGSESVLITGRQEKVDMQIEAQPMGTYNPYALAQTAAQKAIKLVHGKTAGGIITIDVPRAQLQRPASPTDNNGIAEWPLSFIPVAGSGNDQWSITLT